MVDPELAYTYILARVDLAQKSVTISQDGELLKVYDYSAQTVGAWADDDQISDELDESVIDLSVTQFVALPSIRHCCHGVYCT
jgi:hypothetical protein